MSIVNITSHNESIYSLKQVDLPEVARPLIEQSNYRRKLHQNAARTVQKGTHSSMGFQVKPPNPQEYLKKHKQPVPRSDVTKCEPRLHDKRKPPVPPRFTSMPPVAQVQKNFLRQNMRDAVKLPSAAPEPPQKRSVHTRYGDMQPLEPLFHRRPGFGKVPAYLEARKQEGEQEGGGVFDRAALSFQKRQQRAEEVMRRNAEAGDACGAERQTGPRYVCDVDRRDILEGLKHNWAAKMKEFQLLPIITDTIRKIHNKVVLEEELKQLEKDIEKIERHPVIYVMEDGSSLGQ